ncbi:MAG: sulfotransferase family protein [Bacteroidia bacterium]
MVKRLFLWSGPRNISTTLMYSFAQRNDTQVFDEPLYGYYLKETNAHSFHPGGLQIMQSMQCNGKAVVEQMISATNKPVLFYKNMTHHLLNLDKGFMKKGINIILTRNPVEMLPSFHKVIPNPTMADVGYESHLQLIEYFKQNEIEFLVLDSAQILRDPETELTKLCNMANIKFDSNMLKWPKGARSEDGIWAKYWYKSVHNSVGFKKYVPKQSPFPIELKPLLNKCLPIYQKLINTLKLYK